jgi:hypothetical protein
MKKIMMAAAAVGVMALAACAQPASTGDATTYDLSLYPSCDALPEGFDETAGCTVNSEAMMETLLVSREDGVTRVLVIGDGELVQSNEVISSAPIFVPTVDDLNGDTYLEVIVPTSTGNVNTTYAVLLGSPDGTYTDGGEFSGIGWGPSATGLLAVPARSSAASWEVQFFDVEPGGLTLIATVETAIAEEGATPTCRLLEGAVLGAMPQEEAQAQYCGDPAVAGIFD